MTVSVIVAGLISMATCASPVALPTSGRVGNLGVTTTVDTEMAKRYLEDDKTAAELRATFDERPLTWEMLRDLTHVSSVDFATIYFLRRLANDTQHNFWQHRYSTTFKKLRSLSADEVKQDLIKRSRLNRYRFLFVPGFHYKSNLTTGADFAGPRSFLRDRGFDTALIEIIEDGTVEENAAIIATAIRKEAGQGKPIILISTSKGGPEAALALGKLLTIEEARAVQAWVSVGGLLNGTYLADDTDSWPTSWFAKLAFLWEGIDERAIPSIRTVASRSRMAGLRLPKHHLILHYVAAPLSGHIADDVRGRFQRLAEYGPNDGLTLLADELLPQGHAIYEIGLDHYFLDPEIGAKALALAAIVMQELEGRTQPVSNDP